MDNPGCFLQHEANMLKWDEQRSEDPLSKMGATFVERSDHFSKGYTVFESVISPGNFISNKNFEIKV